MKKKRTVSNTTPKEAAKSGVEFSGNPNGWVVLHKAWNSDEGWMRSTKALEIPGVGCLVQVSTHERLKTAESVCFVPDVVIVDDSNGGRKLIRNASSCETHVTFLGNDTTTGWSGNAGAILEQKLAHWQSKKENPMGLPGAVPGDPYRLIRKLMDFFKAKWKVCPTNQQRQELIALLKENLND